MLLLCYRWHEVETTNDAQPDDFDHEMAKCKAEYGLRDIVVTEFSSERKWRFSSRSVSMFVLPDTREVCSMQHATCNTQHATCNMQHAACNMRHATCNTQRAACNMQHATYNMRHMHVSAR